MARGHDGPLRGGPPRPAGGSHPDPYALSDAAFVDALADGVDDTGAIVMRDLEAVDRPRGRAAPRLPVGGIDPGQRHPHLNLARSRRGLRYIHDPEHLRCRSASL